MERRDWRLLVYLVCACVTLLMVACVSSSHPALTPSELPPITLTLWLAATSTALPVLIPVSVTPQPTISAAPTIYLVQPEVDPTNPGSDSGIEPGSLQGMNMSGINLTALAGQPVIITRVLPTLTPQPIQPEPPTCYETAADGLECLGYIRNDRSDPVERVSALVEFYDSGGELLASQMAHVEQHIIPPGNTAPYRTLFTGTAAAELQNRQFVVVSLRSADLAAADTETLPPVIQQETASRQGTVYTIHAQIENPGDAPFTNVRIVITLYDGDHRVAGYRVLDTGELDAGETIPVELHVQAFAMGTPPLSYVLHAEAWSGY